MLVAGQYLVCVESGESDSPSEYSLFYEGDRGWGEEWVED